MTPHPVRRPSFCVRRYSCDNSINYSDAGFPINGTTRFGSVTADNFERVFFANKGALTINGGAGSDATLKFNDANGADEHCRQRRRSTAGGRHARVNGAAVVNTFNVFPTGTDSATVTGAGPVPISAANDRHLIVDGRAGPDSLTTRRRQRRHDH